MKVHTTRTHNVLRGLLLLEITKGHDEIVNLLKIHVDDGETLVKHMSSQFQTIKYLEYLGLGIGCCAVVLAGLALYQYLRK
ncbi:Hypothetical protein POVR1_LOCUS423 [uncultured virus]|nr:Hypothetical protein POVR1_LOCUS423 [uncultured virus]